MIRQNEILWQTNVPRFGKSSIFHEPRCEVFIATGVGIAAGTAAGSIAAGIAAGVAVGGGLVGISTSLYGIASKPGAAKPTAGGLGLNSMQTVVASANAAKNTLATLKAKLATEKAKPVAQQNQTEIDRLTAKIEATQIDVDKWRAEISQIQQNAGVKPVDSAPPGAAFSSPSTYSGPVSGSFGGGGGGMSPEDAMKAGSPPASPQLIIGIAIMAAIGGGIYLARRKKKK